MSITQMLFHTLEAEAIHIFREVAAEAENPVFLYSVGKDSAVMLHLAMKAFYPAKPPFSFLHVDTTWKFCEMIEFRDNRMAELGLDLIVYTNPDGLAKGVGPFTHGSARHTEIMKTDALKQALSQHKFDVALAGRGAMRRSRALRSACSRFAQGTIAGIRRTSARSSGRCTTHARSLAKAFGSFRSPTGPKLTSGNISWLRAFRSPTSIWRVSGLLSSGTAR